MNSSIHKSFLWLFMWSITILNSEAQTPCTNTSLWAWGYNQAGELGDGTNVNKAYPNQINTATDWKSVSAGHAHTLALKKDGSLWAWGQNGFGELGDGTTTNRPTPIKIGTGTDWKQISVGNLHSLAIKNDGSLWAWGYNEVGSLGDGTVSNRLTPTRIGTGTDWKQISVYAYTSMAIKTDGSLWAWGSNQSGQFGNGTLTSQISPTRIGTGTNWKQISLGFDYAVALKTDGSLWAWGDNASGQLGTGTLTNQQTTTRIGTGTDWQQISAGYDAVLAIKTDGTLWVWGGQGNTKAPIKVDNSTNWQQMSAGSTHCLALKTDGTLWAWGNAGFGEDGTGLSYQIDRPIQVGIGSNWQQISAGNRISFALKCSDTDAFVIDPSKCYRILSRVSDKVLQIKEGAVSDGAQIYQADFSSINPSQMWQFKKTADGKYTITSKNSGKLIDVQDNTAAGYCAEGTIIQQFTADGTGSQKWRFVSQTDGSIKIVNDNCNKYLRVENSSTASGASVGIKNDFGSTSFKWQIQEIPCFTPSVGFISSQCYRIVNKATNKVLELKDAAQTDGTQIYQWDVAYTRLHQLWKVRAFSDGKYSIASASSGKVMDILDNTAAGFCVEGTNIQLFPYDGTNSQRWGLIEQTGGFYKIVNTTCNKYLRVEGSSTANGANVGIKNDFGTDAFLWYFQAVDCLFGTPLSATSEVLGFEARASEGRAKLQWITNTGYKNDYFEVERLNANGSFDVLARQNTEGGTDLKSYSFTDNDPLDGDNFYRINSIANGNTPPQYSEVKKVTFSKNDGISIFPNPADDYINIDLRKYEGQTVALSFYNAVGLMVKKQMIEKVSAAPQRVDMQGFGTGSYLLRVQSEGKREVTRLFNITK
jgi:alpha-tubulin suppressor-like RCC1 family protein